MGIMPRLINDKDFTPVGPEWVDVWRLMGAFERMSIMVEDKMLDVGLVDRLYGIQLITLLANDAIYERLKASGAEWQDFIDLCFRIADARKRYNPIIPRDAHFIERVQLLNKTTRNTSNNWGL